MVKVWMARTSPTAFCGLSALRRAPFGYDFFLTSSSRDMTATVLSNAALEN